MSAFRLSRFQRSLLIFACSIGAFGCSQGDRPSLASVEGTVTLDGTPIPNVMVRFEKEGFRAAQGITGSDGRYRLRYIRDIMGGAVGENLVTFMDNSGKRRFPKRFTHEPQNTTVESGSNEIDFDLTSDG